MPRLIKKLLTQTALLVVCAGLLAMGQCTTRIIPPAAPAQPSTIYVCNYGIHSSLLLPLSNGQFVEYLYGDWKWAVLNQKGGLNGGRAIFFSDQAALGRRYLTCATGEKIPMPPEQPLVTPVTISAPGIRRVIAELDARFARQNSYIFHQAMADGGYLYVKDSIHYSVLHDCNSNTAEGLREMGCVSAGMPVWSDFTIERR